jgi:hypothetical protein
MGGQGPARLRRLQVRRDARGRNQKAPAVSDVVPVVEPPRCAACGRIMQAPIPGRPRPDDLIPLIGPDGRAIKAACRDCAMKLVRAAAYHARAAPRAVRQDARARAGDRHQHRFVSNAGFERNRGRKGRRPMSDRPTYVIKVRPEPGVASSA